MEIAIADNNEDERMRDLYEAAVNGCVPTLNKLLQQDPLILHRVSSQTNFFETPLHKSALLGHLEFTKTLLAHYPKLALELDSSQRTPLHLASAQGQICIVRELLLACGDACLVRDQEHRIPLHYAVIRGRRDVVLELIRAKPESLRFHADKGKNILHLCVIHNQLDILKELVALDTNDTNNLLVERDLDGNNTILHLAITSKQVETVRYLLSISKIRLEAMNLKNNSGHSAADTVKRIPQDSKSLQIQEILTENCGIKFENPRNVAAREEQEEKKDGSGGNRGRNMVPLMRKLFSGDGQWVQQMRTNLSLVPTIVATITYQAAVNPPGGVIQQGISTGAKNNTREFDTDYDNWLNNGPLGCLRYKDKGGHVTDEVCPGEAILSYTNEDEFNKFIIYNTISFASSLFIAFLLLSGIPLKSKSMMWVLILGMLSNLTFLLNAYFSSINLITPTFGYQYEKTIPVITWIMNTCIFLTAAYIVVMRLTGGSQKRNKSG